MPAQWTVDSMKPDQTLPYVSHEYDEDMKAISAAVGRVINYFEGAHYQRDRAQRFKDAVAVKPGEDIIVYRARAVEAIDALVRQISPCTDYLTNVLGGTHGVIRADRGIGVKLYKLYAYRTWNPDHPGISKADSAHYEKEIERWDKRMLWDTQRA